VVSENRMTKLTDRGFLDLPSEHGAPAPARYAVLPVPYEGTGSYESGIAAGPAAIIRASRQVELFDEELCGDFSQAGIVTCDAIEPADDPAEQMTRVKRAARKLLASNEFLPTIDGEHSIHTAVNPAWQNCAIPLPARSPVHWGVRTTLLTGDKEYGDGSQDE